ncbi:hypothetical protein Spith_1824 [Spirochaeta thermophila DSM 6578]|uniref:Uncharacterized protein n=1 Tax=Winmispira thermophila (strain ATCC 700085 / DSM 6578 / Z-1203) TaxID=869211 RepID=G0GCL7_WINT7|nr:hypothetical protein [Spirochaeta thermophila]AEJ62083.1 hypothetical protein Spith_1824 [Spirochaeta thermophila DSM 6578]
MNLRIFLRRFDAVLAVILMISLFLPWVSALGISFSAVTLGEMAGGMGNIQELLKGGTSVLTVLRYAFYVLFALCWIVLLLRLADAGARLVSVVTGVLGLLLAGGVLFEVVRHDLALRPGWVLAAAAAGLLLIFGLARRKAEP